MKNTLHFTFLRALMVLAFGLFFNLSWGQETVIYETGFESSEGFVSDNVYNNTEIVYSGPTANRWGTFYGTPSTTSPIAGNQSMQMRSYNNNPAKGYTFTNFSLNGVTKVVFSGQNTSTLRVNASYSVDNGDSWSANTLFVLSSTKTEYTYQISQNGLQNVRVKFEVAFSGANAPTSTARVYIDDVKIYGLTTPTSTTWNGTEWSNGAPTSSLDATIAGNYNTGTNGAITAKTLTVNSGIFTVESGSLASVQGAITNNAGAANFIVKSGGHLIQTDAATNANAITVERNSAPIVRLDHTLWSSPVASQNLFAFSPNTLTNRFYTYDAATNAFINTGLSSASTFVPGKGYGVRAPNNHPTTAAEWLGAFSGVPNNGNQTFTLSLAGTGFNLVGNPYPSAINATTFTNAANNPHINGTIYFYAHSLTMNADGTFPAGTNYTTWNSTGHTLATGSSVVPNGTIQVGQGFIVKAVSAGDVTFTNTMRTGGTTQFFRTSNAYTSNSEVEKHRIWLDLTNTDGSAFNQILIGYVAGATEGVDRNFDGLSFGNTGSSLATKIDGQDYAIQARSLPFQASDVVPLTLKITTAGSYTITLSNLDGLFAGDQGVFLKDNVSGVTHDIKANPYTFNAAVGTFNDRFEVVYNTTLSTPETNLTANSIVAFKRANVLNVESKNIEMASIKAYDVQGRLVYSKSGINANATVLSDLQVQNGVLLLQVTSTAGETATIKVIN